MGGSISNISRVPAYQNLKKIGGFCDFLFKSLPTIGEGFREWFEAPSYEEGVGVVGKMVPSLRQEGAGGCEKRRFLGASPKRLLIGKYERTDLRFLRMCDPCYQ